MINDIKTKNDIFSILHTVYNNNILKSFKFINFKLLSNEFYIKAFDKEKDFEYKILKYESFYNLLVELNKDISIENFILKENEIELNNFLLAIRNINTIIKDNIHLKGFNEMNVENLNYFNFKKRYNNLKPIEYDMLIDENKNMNDVIIKKLNIIHCIEKDEINFFNRYSNKEIQLEL